MTIRKEASGRSNPTITKHWDPPGRRKALVVGIVFLTKITALCLSDHSLGACSKAVKARQAGWGGGEKSNGLTHGSWRIKTSAKSPSLGTLNVTASETWQFSCKREKGMGGASQNRSGRDLLSVWVERGGEEWER